MVATPEGSRFQAWAASLVFSCVCLAAHASTSSNRNGAENWVLAQLCISFIFSFFAVIAYFFAKDKFVGEKPEGGLAFLLVLFWCAGLPVIMNPSRHIAVRFGEVFNANLYFFSWIAFICTLFIFGSYMQELTGREVASELTPKQSKWMGLMAASIVVLSSSGEIHNTLNCNSNLSWDTCSRNAYAISLGVLGSLFSGGMLFLAQSGKLTIMIEFGVAAIMLIMYTFGVAFVTFGSGSGTGIGNLYFSMWICFCVSVFLGFQCFREFMESRNGGGGGDVENNKTSAAAPSIEEVEQAVEAE